MGMFLNACVTKYYQKTFIEGFMAVYPDDVAAAKQYLWQDEQIVVTATQRKNLVVGGALINPTTIVCTDKRLIIINREAMRLRKDVESIPYNRIASVRYENGIVSASIFLQVAGWASSGGAEKGFLKSGEDEGEIPGLTKEDAKALSDFINRMMTSYGQQETESTAQRYMSGQQQGAPQQPQQNAGKQQGGQQPPQGASIYCSKCGTKNPITAKFCTNCGAKLGR